MPAQPYRILCFGDSITAGFHNQGKGYSPYGRTLADALNSDGAVACEVCTVGLCGLAASEMVESLNAPMVKDRMGRHGIGMVKAIKHDGPFDLVIILAGTNDLIMKHDAQDIFNAAVQLHRSCFAQSLPTVAVLPPIVTDVPSMRQILNNFQVLMRKWVSTSGDGLPLSLLDSEELVPRASNVPLWEPDEFHLSPAGSQELGRKLAAAVKPFLVKLRPACPGPCKFRVLEPVAEGMDILSIPKYTAGESVEIWSNHRQRWFPGTVMKVCDHCVQVAINRGNRTVVKDISASNEGLRRANAGTSPTAAKRPANNALQVPAPATSPTSQGGSSPRPPSQLQQNSPRVVLPNSPRVVPSPRQSGGSVPGGASISSGGYRSPGGQRSPAAHGGHIPGLAVAGNSSAPIASNLAGGGGARSPRPAEASSNFIEGADVEIWSKHHKAWCPGKIRCITDGSAVVSLILPTGTGATKAVPLDSDELRLAADIAECVKGPLPTMKLKASATYKADEPVQVWSNSCCCWCDGQVTEVDGLVVKVQFVLPDGSSAAKAILPSKGGLRRVGEIGVKPQEGSPQAGRTVRLTDFTMPAEMHQDASKNEEGEMVMDYHGELGLMELDEDHEIWALGDEVEVWSNSAQAWCAGAIVALEGGVVTAKYSLPDGSMVQKMLAAEDESLRARGY